MDQKILCFPKTVLFSSLDAQNILGKGAVVPSAFRGDERCSISVDEETNELKVSCPSDAEINTLSINEPIASPEPMIEPVDENVDEH